MNLNRWIDGLIPQNLLAQKESIRKARIVVFIHLFLIIMIGVLGIQSMFITEVPDIPVFVLIFFFIGFLLFFKYKGSFLISGNLIALTVAAFLGPQSLTTGGLFSDDLLWLILCPLIAFLIAGKRSGVLWGIFLLGFTAYLYSIELDPSTSLKEQVLTDDPKYLFVSLFILFFIMLSVILIYEQEKNSFIHLLKEQSARLLSQKNEIEQKNQDIDQAHQALLEVNTNLEQRINQRTSSLKKSNEKLLQSNQDLEQFAYVASHDLKEPLRMVGNFVQLLEEEYTEKLDEEGRSYIEFAVNGVKRMSVLIDDLLQFSRIGRKDITFKKVDVNLLVGEKLQNLQQVIKEKNVQIKIAPLPQAIICEKSQLGVVFYNLISNAIKFNDKKTPIIEVSCEEHEQDWHFSIKDNGIGISENNKEKIFEIFKRLHRKEDYEGTGIGLSLCRKIILRHKGKIWLDSTLEKGTTFYFTINKNLKNE